MTTKTNSPSVKKTGLGAKASRRISNFVVYLLVIVMTVVWLVPFFVSVVVSCKV